MILDNWKDLLELVSLHLRNFVKEFVLMAEYSAESGTD